MLTPLSEQVYGLPPQNIRSSGVRPVRPMTKRYNDPIEVEVGNTQVEEVENGQPQLTPSAFSWRGRRYAVAVGRKYWGVGGGGGGSPRGGGHNGFVGGERRGGVVAGGGRCGGGEREERVIAV